jgi:oligopeptide transport system substrate-binding protein
MKKNIILVLFLIVAITMGGSKALAASFQSEEGNNAVAAVAAPTATVLPTPTPAPLKVIVPIEKMAKEIPWLPLDEKAVPMTTFIGINSAVPPFDKPLVRKAFSLAIDRKRISDGEKTRGRDSSVPATSFIPPQILGVDLYQAVGLDFNPEAAKTALKEAGYSDLSKFPKVEIVFYEKSADLVKAYQEMWKTALGVEVTLVPVKSGEELYKYIDEKKPGLFILGVWIADYIDPHNFTFDTFLLPDTQYPKFVEPKFEELITKAKAAVKNPSERQLLYIEAEKILCEDGVFVIPVTHAIITK